MWWDDIQTYIRRHRAEIDLDEARDDLWLDIEEQLHPSARVRPFRWASLARTAAVVLISVGASYFSFGPGASVFSDARTSDPSTPKAEASEAGGLALNNPADQEFEEVEAYYSMQFAKQQKSLEAYDLQAYSFSEQYLEELKQVDEAYQELQEELKEEALFEHRVKTMIQTYELKIRILEQLMQQIRKTNQHEQRM